MEEQANIKNDIKEVCFEDVAWIHLAQDREGLVADSCKHRNEHSASIKGGEFLD
jgi:hypothetical protein